MQTTNSNRNDDALKNALREWNVTTPLPPRFRERVWQRIEAAERAPSAFDLLRMWCAAAFARPAFAVSYVTVLIAAGVALGFKQAGDRTTQWERQLEARYVQAIDPYQRPAE